MASQRIRSLLLLAAALALVAAACTDSTTPTSSTPVTDATTSADVTGTAPKTSTTPGGTSTTVTSTVRELPSDVIEKFEEQIAELIVDTERVRGLTFLQQPDVTVLGPVEFAERLRNLLAEQIDEEEIAVEERWLRLMGLLPDDSDLFQLFIDLYAEQVGGYYDGETKELVVAGSQEDLTALRKSIVVHELIHALADQHHSFFDRAEVLIDEQRFDEAKAGQALSEGDAYYFQLVYIQELSLADQLAVGVEAAGVDTTILNSSPVFLRKDLEYDFDIGFPLVERLVSGGGIAAVDRAYVDPPLTTEQVLNPDRYLAGEVARIVEIPEVDAPGYEVFEEGVFGEWRLRLLFEESLSGGRTTQVGDGWGGDGYRIIERDGEVAMALVYLGDSERDAIETTEALIDHARQAMDGGDGVEDGAGLLFDTDDRYIFIDRTDDQVIFIAATDDVAGRDIRVDLGR